MKIEQILACLLAEMNAMEERMEAKIEANNEKFQVLQGTLVSWMDINQVRTGAMQAKTDASLKEMKASQEYLTEEIEASKEEMKEEMKTGQVEMK
jgi:hypothetical protein